jgi:hypothetical protein
LFIFLNKISPTKNNGIKTKSGAAADFNCSKCVIVTADSLLILKPGSNPKRKKKLISPCVIARGINLLVFNKTTPKKNPMKIA